MGVTHGQSKYAGKCNQSVERVEKWDQCSGHADNGHGRVVQKEYVDLRSVSDITSYDSTRGVGDADN